MNAVKLALYESGVAASKAFLDANGLPSVARYRVRQRLNGTGLYVPSRHTILVDIDATAMPANPPGQRRWSHPGYKVDRTAFGVVAHETGHHVETVLRLRHREWEAVAVRTRKGVSSYEPTPSESFAESMKLFITNPDLLAEGLPRRYAFITALGLKPTVRRSWRAVLPVGFHATAERWIKGK